MEKFLWVKWVSESRLVMSNSATPRTMQSLKFSRPEYWSGQAFPSPVDFPNPGIEPRSPTLQANSLPAEPQGKPKNTGVGSLGLLQWIFLTQESNWGLLHYRQILYQLSYQGSPKVSVKTHNTIVHSRKNRHLNSPIFIKETEFVF